MALIKINFPKKREEKKPTKPTHTLPEVKAKIQWKKPTSKEIEMLKEIIRAWGMDPEKILVKEALREPHRTAIHPIQGEEEQAKILAKALKEMLRNELLN